MRHGMYWSGDLAYRDADGWIYLAGRTADWMRVDGENLAAAPIERILERLPQVSQVAVYAVPDERVGDQVMAALVLRSGTRLEPSDLEEFLAAQPDLSPKAWPRYVRINDDLPATATNKILKRELIAAGVSAQGGVLWTRAGARHDLHSIEPVYGCGTSDFDESVVQLDSAGVGASPNRASTSVPAIPRRRIPAITNQPRPSRAVSPSQTTPTSAGAIVSPTTMAATVVVTDPRCNAEVSKRNPAAPPPAAAYSAGLV